MFALGQLGTRSKGDTGTAVPLMQGNMNTVDAWNLAATAAAHALHTAKKFPYPLDPNWEIQKLNKAEIYTVLSISYH